MSILNNPNKLERFIHEHIHEQARDLVADIIDKWEKFKHANLTLQEQLTFEEILEKENMQGWTIKRGSSGGLVMKDSKTILVNDGDLPLFLHEVAHILTMEHNEAMGDKTGHHSIFADKFTSLVRKYMVGKNINLTLQIEEGFPKMHPSKDNYASFEKYTNCEHKRNNELASDCQACDTAWLIERCKALERIIKNREAYMGGS